MKKEDANQYITIDAKEAIRILESSHTDISTDILDDTEWRKLKPAINMAVKAIKKTDIIVSDCGNGECMICPNCSTAIPVISKYCLICGQAVRYKELLPKNSSIVSMYQQNERKMEV